MDIIVKYDGSEQTNTDQLLTQEQALLAFDDFVAGMTGMQIKHARFFPLVKIKTLETRLVEIRLMMERVVKGEARLVREESHINPETGEKVIDVPEQLAPVPASLDEIKATCFQLVQNDYDVSEPLFAADTVEELQAGLYQVIDGIIQHSNQTNDATFDWWKAQVTGA